ncbi:calmodulin-binding protein-like protein Sha1 [Pleomassaria siparia CBS 279.74]|uniref:Calmodulin-binding protein-like protein Sha1 n=1 Tax=Pleomassaria siparia CBS 279.74 TaxID=1314801 RepID=A0A6G1K3F3_9PLEO|nr:calmodulin-binding protein-like protein Sha1 [Pleomassaria siparia CBS 279.74]
MSRYPDATPCPAPNLSFSTNRYNDYGRQSSVYAPSYSTDDTTANIEYTTELKLQQPRLKSEKPRRPARGTRKPPAFNPSLDIFEDVAQEEERLQQAAEVKRRSRASIMPEGLAQKKSTILSRPAQRIVLPPAAVHDSLLHKTQRRRVSQTQTERHTPEVNATVQLQEDVLEKREMKKPGPRKDPRRRTIFVPSDDTTMITIHPGQPTRPEHRQRNAREQSPDLGLDLVTLSEAEDNLVPVLKKDKKVARKPIAMPPKRNVLQQSTRPVQGTSFTTDVVGKGSGKENVPPGMKAVRVKSSGTNIQFNFDEELKKPSTKPARVHFSASKTTESITHPRTKSVGGQKRLRSQQSNDGLHESPAKSVKSRADGVASSKRTTSLKETIKAAKSRLAQGSQGPLSSSPFHTDRSPPNALRRRKAPPPTITMMHVVGKPQRQQYEEKYPVLSEDLARPELYEDNWLTYQEVAITQLLNSLFDSAGRDPNTELSHEDLRKKLLALYHEPAMPVLHKRLQASLLCGALSLPKDLMTKTLRLKDDVGLRKKFLSLWVKTYDLTSLRAAAETIIGRKISAPCRLSSGSTSSDDGSRQFRAERRAIETFLDAFLIRNEDAVRVKAGVGSIASLARGEHNDDFGSQAWSWRRTTLRSLMLVILLDKAKTQDILPGCLFQTTSPHKTSTEVLHFLSNILIPSLGDITRPLGHLSYKVEQCQYPLQEYTYHIDNIAVDLRDGVHLTRLVELLLYPPTTLVAQREETVTVTMPTGDILTSTFDFDQKESWVLSQHLKFPSIGRAQKLYNVQIALAALTGVQGLPDQIVQGVRADDIVDGHREKTLSLLWSLVGRCGLATLVDWSQIVKEIEHFRDSWYSNRDNYAQRDLDSDEDEPTTKLEGMEYHKRLLLSWARSIGRLHGLRITNLTTSFSDPRVLEAIVDAYLPSALVSATTKLSLSMKLKATGCSASFIALFTPNASSPNPIPSKDFTLLTLSFLASRLLPLSRSHRAASTIQRAFRRHLQRNTVHTRVVLMRLAADCAAVVQTRNRLMGAATLIQRRWKAILDNRRERLRKDVEAFQALARGWAIRRWVRRVTAGRIGGKEKARRIRGGW